MEPIDDVLKSIADVQGARYMPTWEGVPFCPSCNPELVYCSRYNSANDNNTTLPSVEHVLTVRVRLTT